MNTKTEKDAQCARFMGWNPPDGLSSWSRIPQDEASTVFYHDEPSPNPPPYTTDNQLAAEVLDWFSENGYTWELGRDSRGIFGCLIIDTKTNTLAAEVICAPTWQEAIVDARIAIGEV